MNLHDETLQTRAQEPDDGDADLTAEERADVAAYRAIFGALEDEPVFRLPAAFAEAVAKRAAPAREPLWAWLALPVAVLLPLAAATVLVPDAFALLILALEPARAMLGSIPLPLIGAVLFTLGVLLLADRWLGPRMLHPAS